MRIKLLLAPYLKKKGVTAFYSSLPLSSCLPPFSLDFTTLSPLIYPFFPHAKHLTEVLKSKRQKNEIDGHAEHKSTKSQQKETKNLQKK